MTCSDRRIGEFFQTHTGKRFFPLDPQIDDIDIRDIAHALSNICRFGGHTREFYSVAQHCVLVSEIVHSSIALEGLLHDAAEAYVGDMVRPLKVSMPNYKAIERHIEGLIAEKWMLAYPWAESIKRADNIALATEKRDVLAVKVPWTGSAAVLGGGELPLDTQIVPWESEYANARFLGRFIHLAAQREAALKGRA